MQLVTVNSLNYKQSVITFIRVMTPAYAHCSTESSGIINILYNKDSITLSLNTNMVVLFQDFSILLMKIMCVLLFWFET